MKELWKHQSDAIEKAKTTKDIALFFEQGTGKTRTMIEILRRRYAASGRVMKTLILCPIIVCENWKREFAMYSKINPVDILSLTQSGAKRCREVLRWCGDDLSRDKIIITNYQGMLIKDLYDLIVQWDPEIIICDESQRVKNHDAKTFKKVQAIADTASQRFILTGTPILNTPMDIWAQFRVLDGGETFSKNFYVFRSQYFTDKNAARANTKGHFPDYIPTSGAIELIQEKIKTKALRVLKKDCLDLPPLIRQEYVVDLSPEQIRMYKEMYKEFIAFVQSIDGKAPMTVTAQLAVTKSLRLQQIVSGYCQTEETGSVWIKENPRLSALSELLEDIAPHSKVIVWSVFKENYKMITKLCERLGLKYAEIHGDISNKQREDEMDRFRNDPTCRVMVANQSAGGSGINLVEASYSIYYSKGFSLEADLQSEARNHRAGSEQHDKITRIDLVAKGTIDEVINQALQNKQNVAEAILTWGKECTT